MKKFSFKERLRYWFDNRMSGGSMGLIRLLCLFSLAMVLAVTLIITVLHFNPEQGFTATLWESFSTVVNAWMPSSEDGPVPYVLMLGLAAVGGLFITSILIGLISSAIEEKITSLKQGRSQVLESGHTVLLGFTPGECTLIRQLILSAAGKPRVIVVAADLEPDEIVQSIEDNVTVPDSISLICRQADIQDCAALERLMVTEARSVIISPQNDRNTIKTLLAVSNLISTKEDCTTRISAILSGTERRLPTSLAERHNITAVQTNRVLAKMIAHSCTQCGLSQTFQEVYNFEGSEFYMLELPECYGTTFLELLLNMEGGVPSGILHDGKVTINPPPETVLQDGDKVLVFAEDRFTPKLTPSRFRPEEAPGTASPAPAPGLTAPAAGSSALSTEAAGSSILSSEAAGPAVPVRPQRVTIIGCNKELPTVIANLPQNVKEVMLAGADEAVHAKTLARLKDLADVRITFFQTPLEDETAYEALARQSAHIAILSDYSMEEDDADMDVIFHILNLRDVRIRCGLHFNITAELCLGSNEALISNADNTDYIVSSNMASLILAQLSESPELIDVFRELLSNEGYELFLRTAEELECTGPQTIRSLRAHLCRRKCVLLGLLEGDEEDSESVFNPPLDKELELTPENRLIILSEM